MKEVANPFPIIKLVKYFGVIHNPILKKKNRKKEEEEKKTSVKVSRLNIAYNNTLLIKTR